VGLSVAMANLPRLKKLHFWYIMLTNFGLQQDSRCNNFPEIALPQKA
jgi:hypothetical protein